MEFESELKNAAILASESAYAPYSKFHVGAAILCLDSKIITGCNVENRSYGLGVCAERNAIATAINQKCQHFLGIAIYSPQAKKPLAPCGACRQVLAEFFAPNTFLYLGCQKKWLKVQLSKIFPMAFDEDLSLDV